MPQQAVSPVGNDHGQGNLGIDLRQPAGQAADIQVAVLELSGTEQRLPFRRHERLRYVESRMIPHRRGLQGTALLFQQHPAVGILEKEFPFRDMIFRGEAGRRYRHTVTGLFHVVSRLLNRLGINQFLQHRCSVGNHPDTDGIFRERLKTEGSFRNGNPNLRFPAGEEEQSQNRYYRNLSHKTIQLSRWRSVSRRNAPGQATSQSLTRPPFRL